MNDNLHQRARAVFLELSTLDGPVASSELDRLVGDDAALRAAVISLLDARQDANDAGLMTEETRSQLSAPITESAGTIIGPYKILQLIGEGGFGSVFLAEQAEPVRRRVALKIIKLGMDTKQVIARFEAERQALALMDHPHIARVFDAGSTDSGRPYFAMEYVVGDAITKFADDYKLDIDARLKLLAQVCSAVQHAHTKGVIHRDLKPANVLVSMVDGKPFAKVIDFGIAKATASPLTHKTLFTEHRQLIGTPEYMSPEQAEGSPDIDTRTDVYALGVLLYELLTGATPFDATRLRSAAWAEMQRIIREEEPPIPSMRLSRDAALSQRTAATRQTEPPRLASSIRGELDWIVMKALDKDRGRRYSTPLELAEDIGKHLSGDAVEAAPPSAAYRLRKFARRNKGSVIAGAVVSAVLILGIAGTTTGLLIAQYNAKAALHNADLAMESSSEAEWSAYTANLALAQNAMDAGDWPKAREYLAACPESKRGWEWEFLGQYAHSVTIEVPGFWSAASFDSDGTLHLLGNRETSYQTEDERTYTFAVDAESIVPNGAGRQTLVALSPEDDIESSSTAWTTTFENYVGFVHDWKEQFATFHPRGWGYTIRALRHAADGRVVLSTQSFEYPHLQVFDTRSETLVGSYHYGEGEAPQIINMSGDLRWLLAIVRSDGDGWRDKYCRAVLIDTRNAGSPVRILGSGDRTRLAIADMLGSAPTEPVKSIDLPDRSRRIAIGPDRDIQFFDTSGGSDPLKQRQIASFRVPLAALSLHLSDDEQRIVVTLADGSAQVWDIRDPAERRIDIEREWNEREPATKYVASLLSSDATSDADELKESILRDDSLTPLRRYVSIDILYERLNEIALDASWEFDRITANQTDKDVVLAAARESDLVPREKAMLLAKAEAWEYRAPDRSTEARLADEVRQRELAERALQARSYAYYIQEAYASWERSLYDTANDILSLCPEDLRGVEWHALRSWCNVRRETFAAHDGPIAALAFSKLPGILASSGADRSIKVWDCQVQPPNLTCAVANLDAVARSLRFTPDGSALLSVGDGPGITVRDGKTLAVLRVIGRDEGLLEALAVGREGTWCAAGRSDGRIIIWDLNSGDLFHELRGHESPVTALYSAPLRDLLVSGDETGWLMMWDPIQGVRHTNGSTRLGDDTPYSIQAIGHDGNGRIIAGPLAGRSMHDDSPPITLAPDLPGVLERSVVSYTSDDLGEFDAYRLRINPYTWLGNSGSPEPGYDWQEQIPDDRPIRSRGVASSSDGRWLAGGRDDGTIRLSVGWHGYVPDPIRVIWDSVPGFSDDGIAGHSNGNSILVQGSAGLLRIPMASGEPDAWIRTDSNIQSIAASSPDGRWALLRMKDGPTQLLDTRKNRYLEGFDLPGTLTFAPSGEWFAQADDNAITIRSVPSGEVLRSFDIPLRYGAQFTLLAISPDTRLIGFATINRSPDRETYPIGGIRGGDVGVVDAESGDLIWTSDEFPATRYELNTMPPPVKLIAFDPNSQRLLVASRGLAMFEARSGVRVGSAVVSRVGSLCFTPDGSRFFTTQPSAAYGRPDQVSMWDSESMTCLLTWDMEFASDLFMDPSGTELVVLGGSNLTLVPFGEVRGARPIEYAIAPVRLATEIAEELQASPETLTEGLESVTASKALSDSQKEWVRGLIAQPNKAESGNQ